MEEIIILNNSELSDSISYLGQVSKETYNNVLFIMLNYYEKHSYNPLNVDQNMTKMIQQFIKIKSFFKLPREIGIHTLSYILQSISKMLKSISIEDFLLNPNIYTCKKNYQILIPKSVIEQDLPDIKCSNKSIKDIITSSTLYEKSKYIQINYYDQYFKIYFHKSINKLFDSYLSKVEKYYLTPIINKDDNQSIVYRTNIQLTNFHILAIDLGSTNFVNAIDTTFKCFILDATVAFTYLKLYLETIDTIDNKKDLKIIAYKFKKWINSFIIRVADNIITYCKINNIDAIACGVAGQRFDNVNNVFKYFKENIRVDKFNFSAILQGLLRYKLQSKVKKCNINFYDVNEKNTSQICSRCEFRDRRGRNRNKNLFICKKCHAIINGDINAAINILKRYISQHYKNYHQIWKVLASKIDFGSLSNIDRQLVIKRLPRKNPFRKSLTK